MSLTQDRLKELLHYNKNTGIFTWKIRKGNSVVGDVAGCLDSYGYVIITIDRKLYKSHRLAFLYIEGYFPENVIDHKNGKKNNNKWDNLRHVSQTCNRQNNKKTKKNTSGFVGVVRRTYDEKWVAQIWIMGKAKNLGSYNNKIDAALARLTEEIWNPNWTCSHMNQIVVSLREEWPEFNLRCIG